MADTDENAGLLALTADIVAAHVSNNSVAVGDLPTLIKNVHGSLAGLGAQATPEPAEQTGTGRFRFAARSSQTSSFASRTARS